MATEPKSEPSTTSSRKEYWAERYRERRDYITKYKMDRGCELCGYKAHPAALTFDHLDPADKAFNLSDHTNRNWQKIMDEIDKCRVICANCHNIHTHDSDYFSARTDE